MLHFSHNHCQWAVYWSYSRILSLINLGYYYRYYPRNLSKIQYLSEKKGLKVHFGWIKNMFAFCMNLCFQNPIEVSGHQNTAVSHEASND